MTDTSRDYQPPAESRRVIGWLVATLLVFGALLVANYLRPALINKEELEQLGYVVLEEKTTLKQIPMVDHEGQTAGIEMFQGRWSLVFFGFTYCPDVCPTTLAVLNRLTEILGDLAPQVILVSVDPERDTSAVLGDYVSSFNPDFIGLTGSSEALVDFADQLHMMFARVPGIPEYTIQHSTHIAVIDPNGDFTGYFRIPHREETMATALRQLM
jgi:protein SCO1/2